MLSRPIVTVAGRLGVALLHGRHSVSPKVRDAGFDDVSWTQCMVLRFCQPEGCRPTQLSSDLQMSKQAVNDCLRHLEDRGYLTRLPLPGDGRARIVRLTGKGEGLRTVIRSAERQVELKWEEAIGEPDWSTFTRVLDHLAGAELDADARN